MKRCRALAPSTPSLQIADDAVHAVKPLTTEKHEECFEQDTQIESE